MVAAGRISMMVKATGTDTTGLGWWAWVYMGGGGNTTCILVAYQPCQPLCNTGSDTVWEQHRCYFKAQGNTKSLMMNFQDDLVALLTEWKIAGNEIVLMGDFNEDVYTGILSVQLPLDPLRLQELCRQTTGQPLPPTHNQGRIPMDAIFGTAGVEPTAAILLPSGAGMGDHRVFLIDLSSQSLIGDAFPRVLPAAACLLNCDSDCIQSKYNRVLNQLANRHLLFHKLLQLGRDLDSLSKVQFLVRINTIDKELEEFMKASKKECHVINMLGDILNHAQRPGYG
jgi:hypothetical protein